MPPKTDDLENKWSLYLNNKNIYWKMDNTNATDCSGINFIGFRNGKIATSHSICCSATGENYFEKKCYEILENRFSPERIIFNPPATIVFWKDGTKTVVKCSKNDEFNKYHGFCAALAKKMYISNSALNRMINEVPVNKKSEKKEKEPEKVKPNKNAKSKKKGPVKNG